MSKQKITKVAKGERYESKDGQLIEVTNGRLRNEGDLGHSFTGRTLAVNVKTGQLNPAKKEDRFYLDELVRKLTKKQVDEWLTIELREVEAAAAAASETKPESTKAMKKTVRKQRKRADGKLNVLNAALKVLTDSGEPMNCKAMVETMLEQKLWKTNGKTPHATLYSAIIREIQNKGDDARFRKTDRGQFVPA